MSCDRIIAELDDYLDEELAPDARWELEAHLKYCGPCQATLKRAMKLKRALGAYPVQGPSPGFFDRALQEAPFVADKWIRQEYRRAADRW